MAKFNLELSAYECGILMFALGSVYEKVPESFSLAQRIASLSIADAAKPSQPKGIPAAVATSAAPGNPGRPEPPAPPTENLTEELTITLVSAELSADKKSLVTTCKTRTTNGVKSQTLRCWDPKRFEEIKASVGKSTTFLTKQTDRGFTNIVGVK